jgi:hypothetical protein
MSPSLRVPEGLPLSRVRAPTLEAKVVPGHKQVVRVVPLPGQPRALIPVVLAVLLPFRPVQVVLPVTPVPPMWVVRAVALPSSAARVVLELRAALVVV